MRRGYLISAFVLAGFGRASDESIVKGQYLEDRSSRVYGCPCEWSSESISNGREAVLGWKFESGRYEGEDLAGLGLAAVLAGKATLSEATTLRRSTVCRFGGT